MPVKISKKIRSKFFDPARIALTPETYLLQYLSQTKETLLGKSADALLKEAEDVFKKVKQINSAFCQITQDQLENVSLKALEALNISAEKYKLEKKDMEANCVYQLIESQASRYLGPLEPYETPSFR